MWTLSAGHPTEAPHFAGTGTQSGSYGKCVESTKSRPSCGPCVQATRTRRPTSPGTEAPAGSHGKWCNKNHKHTYENAKNRINIIQIRHSHKSSALHLFLLGIKGPPEPLPHPCLWSPRQAQMLGTNDRRDTATPTRSALHATL